MSKIELKFIDCDWEHFKIETYNFNGEIKIAMYQGFNMQQITLDIPTAIKFAKTLRTEINKAKCI